VHACIICSHWLWNFTSSLMLGAVQSSPIAALIICTSVAPWVQTSLEGKVDHVLHFVSEAEHFLTQVFVAVARGPSAALHLTGLARKVHHAWLLMNSTISYGPFTFVAKVLKFFTAFLFAMPPCFVSLGVITAPDCWASDGLISVFLRACSTWSVGGSWHSFCCMMWLRYCAGSSTRRLQKIERPGLELKGTGWVI